MSVWTWMRRLVRPRRWTVVIVGRESGTRTTFTAVRFRSYDEAAAWCVRMNARSPWNDLTYWEPIPE